MPKVLGQFAVCGAASVAAVKAAEGESKQPTFEMLAYSGGMLRLTYWYYPVVLDIRGIRVKSKTAVLYAHDRMQIVGQANRAKKTASEIRLSGIVTGDASAPGDPAHTVVSHAQRGYEWPVSVGVEPTVMEFIAEGQKVKVNGQTFSGPLTLVREGDLGEVSFVAIGADGGAHAKVAATVARNSREIAMSFEQWVEAQGWKVSDLTETQRASLQAAFSASSAGAVDAPPMPGPTAAPPATPPRAPEPVEASGGAVDDAVASIRVGAAAEVTRIAEIRKVCAGTNPKIEAQAIAEGWSPEKCELTVLRASRATAPAIHAHQPNNAPLVIEASVARGARMPGLEKVYDAKTLEESHRMHKRGIMGMMQLIGVCAARLGWTGGMVRDDLRGAMQAAFSTNDLSGILSNVANKFLLMGFDAVDQAWRAISAIRPVSDFKAITSYKLTGDMQHEKVAPTGELRHASLGEETFSNQADTYGAILKMTRKQIINDDLGALNEIPMRIGRGAALKLNDVFWTAFLANSSFFTTARKNYASGAATALSFSAISAAEALFLKQVDANGKPIAVMPKVLLVPSDLSALARGYTQSPEYRELPDTTTTGQAAKQFFTRNIHAERFMPVTTPYLQNSAYTGYSAAAWYMLADPNDVPVIEVCFLNGQQTPTVESADADFDTLGIQFRGYHDFGVALQDHRGGVKMKGEA